MIPRVSEVHHQRMNAGKMEKIKIRKRKSAVGIPMTLNHSPR